MADYYPLLAKAVAKLIDATPEARQEIYERARKALSSQLRDLDPPVPEEAIAREAQALEVAVAQVEMDAAANSFSRIELPADEMRFEAMRPAAGTPPALEQIGSTATPHEPATQSAKGEAGYGPGGRTANPQKSPQALPLKIRRKAGEKRPRKGAEKGTFLPDETLADAPHPGTFSRRSGPQPRAIDTADFAGPATGEEKGTVPPIMEAAALNSFASGNTLDQTRPKRLIAAFAIASAVVAAIAIAAYRLRDRPEDLLRLQPQPLQGEAASGDKIADRIDKGSGVERLPPSSGGLSDAERKVTAAPVAPLPVSHRAALLVEAKDGTNKVNTYIGRVIWRAENVSSGPDEPLRTAVRAEIEIPEIKLQANVMIQKNFDSTLSASHTVKLAFTLGGDSPLGNIRQISAVQMRQQDTPVGDTLDGITVPIVENSFLIGLARGAAEASNLDRLRTREWVDVPMVLASGLSAKLTLEKGQSGQRIFEDTIASWQGQ